MKDSIIKTVFKEDQNELASPNQESAAADGEPKTQNQRPLLNDANTSLSAPDPSDGEAPTQGQVGRSNRAESSQGGDINDDGADESNSNSLEVENKHLIPTKRGYLPVNVVLYHAALKGDWKIVKSILDSDPSAIRMKITFQEETVLHIAASEKQVGFVEKLVKLLTSSDLTLRDKNGFTAFHYASTSGVVRIAAVMVEKNPDLPNILPPQQLLPVSMAVAYKRKDMASFLFSKTNFDALETPLQIGLLHATILNDYYDIALDILKKKPKLATVKMNDQGTTALHMLARKPSTIGSSGELIFWKRYINSWFKGIYNKALMQTLAHQLVETLWKAVLHDLSNPEDFEEFIGTPTSLLHDAARVGNAELLIILSFSCPYLLWRLDDGDKTIFHVAVENRQESVFSLMYEIEGLKEYMPYFYDKEKNMNMLHLAGKLAAPYHLNRVSGAALQMQRELLWFKEVEKIILSYYLNMRCSNIQTELSNIDIRNDQIDQLTPRELFTKEHKQLLKDGEKWMKSSVCWLQP